MYVQLCLASGSCGGWIKYTGVGSKLLIARGMAAGTSFHLQFEAYGVTKSFTVNGDLSY